MLGVNNESCFDTIRKMREKNRKVGLILTSPPYNTGRNSNSERDSAIMQRIESKR